MLTLEGMSMLGMRTRESFLEPSPRTVRHPDLIRELLVLLQKLQLVRPQLILQHQRGLDPGGRVAGLALRAAQPPMGPAAHALHVHLLAECMGPCSPLGFRGGSPQAVAAISSPGAGAGPCASMPARAGGGILKASVVQSWRSVQGAQFVRAVYEAFARQHRGKRIERSRLFNKPLHGFATDRALSLLQILPFRTGIPAVACSTKRGHTPPNTDRKCPSGAPTH